MSHGSDPMGEIMFAQQGWGEDESPNEAPQDPLRGKPTFDFSEFHDLMHPIASRTCWSLPGGPWRHLVFTLQYRWDLPYALWERPLHALGHHYFRPYWTGLPEDETEEPSGWICTWCSEVSEKPR